MGEGNKPTLLLPPTVLPDSPSVVEVWGSRPDKSVVDHRNGYVFRAWSSGKRLKHKVLDATTGYYEGDEQRRR